MSREQKRFGMKPLKTKSNRKGSQASARLAKNYTVYFMFKGDKFMSLEKPETS
jgi:hypothetical protein